MASSYHFNSYPPFPSDTPTASLTKVSLAKLFSGDVEQSKAMFDCCRTVGFFLLDLSGNEVGEAIVKDLDAMLDITKETMSLSEEEKNEYKADPPKKLLGYKSLGYMKTETNQPDRCEFFMVSQDDLRRSFPSTKYPAPITTNLPLFRSYISRAQEILHLICRILATGFDLPPSTFYSKQSPDSQSGTMVRMIKYPAVASDADRRTSLVPHTDMGTITFLASVLGGLQILPPSTSNNPNPDWVHIRPEPCCLIVNMGDAMVQWTGGVLRSNVHRVTFPPGDQARYDRYSIAFLVRAAANASMETLKGGLIPDAEGDDQEDAKLLASEWEKKKSLALIQGKDCVRSTGGRPLKGES